jgi:ribonuclease HI
MSVPAPHFLLHAEVAPAACGEASHLAALTRRPLADTLARGERAGAGCWRFVLRLPSGETSLEAADEEPEATPQRLELLAVVRGLEALEQPSRITLVTSSAHLRRGLCHGLTQWKENDWQWERYGRMTPVKNDDLWRRLDRLLMFHSVECQPTALEKADDFAPPRPATQQSPRVSHGNRLLRIDAGHGPKKHQISTHKHQTNPKFKRRLSRTDRGLVHSKYGIWSLFHHWSLVICRLIVSLAHRLQTRSQEH